MGNIDRLLRKRLTINCLTLVNQYISIFAINKNSVKNLLLAGFFISGVRQINQTEEYHMDIMGVLALGNLLAFISSAVGGYFSRKADRNMDKLEKEFEKFEKEHEKLEDSNKELKEEFYKEKLRVAKTYLTPDNMRAELKSVQQTLGKLERQNEQLIQVMLTNNKTMLQTNELTAQTLVTILDKISNERSQP